MTKLSKTAFKNKYNDPTTGLFKDNTAGDISEGDSRSLVDDTADSFASQDALAAKANSATVTTLAGRVTQNETDISSNTTNIANNTTALGNKLDSNSNQLNPIPTQANRGELVLQSTTGETYIVESLYNLLDGSTSTSAGEVADKIVLVTQTGLESLTIAGLRDQIGVDDWTSQPSGRVWKTNATGRPSWQVDATSGGGAGQTQAQVIALINSNRPFGGREILNSQSGALTDADVSAIGQTIRVNIDNANDRTVTMPQTSDANQWKKVLILRVADNNDTGDITINQHASDTGQRFRLLDDSLASSISLSGDASSIKGVLIQQIVDTGDVNNWQVIAELNEDEVNNALFSASDAVGTPTNTSSFYFTDTNGNPMRVSGENLKTFLNPPPTESDNIYLAADPTQTFPGISGLTAQMFTNGVLHTTIPTFTQDSYIFIAQPATDNDLTHIIVAGQVGDSITDFIRQTGTVQVNGEAYRIWRSRFSWRTSQSGANVEIRRSV